MLHISPRPVRRAAGGPERSGATEVSGGSKAGEPGAGGRPIVLAVPRIEQPDDVTCGPTCLGQIYQYYGYAKPIAELIDEVPRTPDGGTLAVHLGANALRAGFAAELYSYNLRVVDPTWRKLSVRQLIGKLNQRLGAVKSRKLIHAIAGYVEFLELGGRVRFAELTPELLVGILRNGHPILTGLSATYLYGTPREYEDEYDDVRGDPVGHFVAVAGYYPQSGRFLIRDPSTHIPFSRTGKYSVKGERLTAAILLGDVTYDAVLLVVKPSRERPTR